MDAAGRVGEGGPDPAGPTGAQAGTAKVRLARMAGLLGEAGSVPGTERCRGAHRGGGRAGTPPGRSVERWIPPGVRVGWAVGGRRLAWCLAVAGVVTVGALVAVLTAERPRPEPAPPLPVARETPGSGRPGTVGRDGTAGTDAGAGVAGGAADAGPGGRGGSTAPSGESPPSLVVSVVGDVADPGLLTLPPGARVADAIERAGGAGDDADLYTVNLARELSDGEQIHVGVPVPSQVRTGRAPTTGTGPGVTAPVELNTAGRAELETLPGVGEVTAGRILDWRADNGRFTAVEQLREVDGIGPKRFARLRDRVSVG